MNRKEEALKHFNEGYNCTKAIVSTYAPLLHLPEKAAKYANSPSSSIFGPQEVCGVVRGAEKVLQMKYHEDHHDELIQNSIQEFEKRFLEMNNAKSCKDLLGCDLSTRKGQYQAMEEDLCDKKCAKYVADAIEILEDMLDLAKV